MNYPQNYKMITHYYMNSLFLPYMMEFKVEGDYITMIQLLKATGLVQTGGEAQIVVEDGEVIYNGEVDYRKRLKVKPGDLVEFRGQKIKAV
jgi:ribosome-associated protein